MNNARTLFCARHAIELGCVLAAVIAVTIPLHGLSKTQAVSDATVLFLLLGTTLTLITLSFSGQTASATNNRLRAFLQSTKTWGLTVACAGLIAVAALDVPIFSVDLILLYGWALFALLTLLDPKTTSRRDSASPAHSDLTERETAAKATYERARLGMRPLRRTPRGRLTKRTIDVLGSALGILILLPVFAACALAVKLNSRGPILFRQSRIGKDGNAFTCLKFRTMTLGAQDQLHLLRQSSTQDGPAFKMPNDPRITQTGQYLRKYSLDELPQLFNVLFGNMSLVGPRPSVPSEVADYESWQLRRITIKPGLTCIWQVWGRNQVSFDRWMEMDLAYIDNWSTWLDIKLIVYTVPVMFKGTGM